MTPLLARRLLFPLTAALLAAVPGPAHPELDAFRTSKHGNPTSGAFRDQKYRPGTCLQCHGTLESTAGRGPSNAMALFAANDDGLCLSCHKTPLGLFPERSRLSRSTHGESSQVVWPGPKPKARRRADAGRCVNCHDPHGTKDAKGPIPGMLLLRGDDLCLACHRAAGGGQDIATEVTKVSRHPRPGGVEVVGAMPGPGCTDCHNPHLARREPSLSMSGVSGLLDGVRRVRPVNGAPGSIPRLAAVGPEDRTPTREYEVCFRCHAGTPDGPAGTAVSVASGAVARSQVASAFNPANPSYHPVEAPGRDTGIDLAAFAPGWRADRLVTCSDCHGSVGGQTRGPHGSSLPSMLRKRYLASAAPGRVEETDLCFDCHAWGAYGSVGAGPSARGTRYAGHALHSARGVSCHACHDPHGSSTQPALLVLRTPGLVSYRRDVGGGSCTVSCHTRTPPVSEYRLVYPR